MDYTKEQLIKNTKELYNEIDSCITDLVNAKMNHDAYNEEKAIIFSETLLCQSMQQFGCILDYLEPKDEPITEEWLEKNGFIQEENIYPYSYYTKDIYSYYTKDMRVEVTQNRNEWNVHVDDEYNYTIGNLYCKTTNQLIEFCRLCEYEI